MQTESHDIDPFVYQADVILEKCGWEAHCTKEWCMRAHPNLYSSEYLCNGRFCARGSVFSCNKQNCPFNHIVNHQQWCQWRMTRIDIVSAMQSLPPHLLYDYIERALRPADGKSEAKPGPSVTDAEAVHSVPEVHSAPEVLDVYNAPSVSEVQKVPLANLCAPPAEPMAVAKPKPKRKRGCRGGVKHRMRREARARREAEKQNATNVSSPRITILQRQSHRSK